MVPEQIEREVVIAAPVEQVWTVLTEAEHIGAWFGDAGAEVDLRPGGRLVLRWQEHGTHLARIEKVEPFRLFSYRWARPVDEEPLAGNSTLVEFTLSREGESARLHVVESGFRTLALSDEEKAAHAAGNVEGWISELAELQAYVEQVAA